MTEEQSKALVDENQDKLNLTKEQIKRWAGKKYLCLVEICDSEEIEPLILDRQLNMDDWIAVEDINSIVKKDDGTPTEYKAVRFTDIAK